MGDRRFVDQKDLVTRVPDVEPFRLCCVEECLVGGDKAHVWSSQQIARDNGTSKLDCVQGSEIMAINQRISGFENWRIDRLFDDPPQFIR